MKLIATDLDGTLLNELGQVSPENAAAIKQALKAGIEVIVATGRAYETAVPELEAVGLHLPMITLNGAVVFSENHEKINDIPLDKELAQQIAKSCQENDIYFEVFSSKGVFSTSREYFTQVVIDIVKTSNPDVSTEEIKERIDDRFRAENVQFTTDYEAILKNPDIDIYKVLAFSPDETSLAQIKAAYQHVDSLAITASASVNLEFNHRDAQKGIALKAFAESKGIDLQDVMAIGDNYNDLSMLKIAGHSVAMENADDEIKAHCDTVTKRNDENGVAHAIQKVLEKR
ncbi:MAG TPA: Cof-type HAD-IIB family hydrolase [Cerasibacillus sp.]|uniref:Cof-type HAD-IIB family hydrolase n=1 Tax=Cerasibacillus sp. TaxID=2498711 RepID=UPI002F4029E2